MRSTHTYILEAQQLIDIGRVSEAIPVLGQAIASEPQSSRPRCLLSLAYFKLGNFKESLAAANEAVALAPYNEWAHRLRALNLLRLKRKREALEAAREAAQLSPDMPETLHVLALSLSDNGKGQEAREVAGRMVQLAPESALSHHTAGLMALRMRKWAEAEEHYRRALAIDPEDSDYMNNLGLVLKQQGKKKEAIDRFHDAARLNPKSETSRKNLREAVGGYASISFAALYVLAQVTRALVNASAEDANPIPAVIGALVIIGLGVGFIIWRRRRLAELNENVKLFYEVETRRLRRANAANILARSLLFVTALTLIIFSFIVFDNLSSGRGLSGPVSLSYALLWLALAAEIVWLVRNPTRQ